MSDSKIRVAEMFAGVGGFHLGLSRASENYDIVWADQFEPSRSGANQFAYNIYKNKFPKTNIVNDDISLIDKHKIPDIDMLVGGFPCQDYSVATTNAKGLYGKKGVLWWDIKDVIEAKWPQFIFLENVDRLLASPGVKSNHPGRDFGMILKTLSDLGYGVSWKMINAADYGFPQRRRRTFIFAYREDTNYKAEIKNIIKKGEASIKKYIKEMPPFSSSLKNLAIGKIRSIDLNEYKSLVDFSDNFKIEKGFRQTGVMIDGVVFMSDYDSKSRKETSLNSIIKPNESDKNLYLSSEKIEKFKELKDGFQTIKVSKGGYKYKYGMGRMAFPDPLDKPARTMVTSEHTVSRMTHVILDPGNKKLRLISADEAEMINTFPKGWTMLDGVTETNRYFAMGNALVVDLIKEIGIEIKKIINSEEIGKSYVGNKSVAKIIH